MFTRFYGRPCDFMLLAQKRWISLISTGGLHFFSRHNFQWQPKNRIYGFGRKALTNPLLSISIRALNDQYSASCYQNSIKSFFLCSNILSMVRRRWGRTELLLQVKRTYHFLLPISPNISNWHPDDYIFIILLFSLTE